MKNKLFISFFLIALIGIMSFLYVINHSRRDSTGLKVYRDPVHHYRVSYPNYLKPIISDAVTHQEVTFISEGDPWTVAVSVATTTVTSARAWVEEYNRKSYTGSPPYTTRYRIERETIVSGIPAIIVHPYSDFQRQHEEYIHDRSALVVKDGKLFTISTRTTDPERIWDTFKFEE